MYKRLRKIVGMFLKLAVAAGLLLAVTILILVGFNRRDTALPDFTGLEPALCVEVPASSNGWYFIREAVRDAWVPNRTEALHDVWRGMRQDAPGIRDLLASNTLALAWIDRAAASRHVRPPRAPLAEDGNWLGWSPVGRCGRLLRLRAELALLEGRTGDALRDYRESLRLARLYLDCPPANETDALAAFVEVRDALHGLRDASGRLGARAVWEQSAADLRVLSDLHEARRRASAAALEADRLEIGRLHRIATGEELPPANWTSPFVSVLPDEETLADGHWAERFGFHAMSRLPASYRLHPNRTLTVMAGIRRGGPLPASVRQVARARRSPSWGAILAPAGRYLGPNGLGEFYIIIQAERQEYIERGTRLAECAGRGTRLSLALRLYEEEHGGLPEHLDALVPAWLEAVPADPYDGRPFRYDRARRLVYSVGPNRCDDGGKDDVRFPIPD